MLAVAGAVAATRAAVPERPDESARRPIEPAAALRPAAPQQDVNAPYDGLFHFARIRYDVRGRGFGGFGRRGRGREPMWAHDWPRAERNFLAILQETTFIGTRRTSTNVVELTDPELFRYPLAYIVEPGAWDPTDEDVAALGDYLRKGGFLIVDDFRGPYELQKLDFHLRRALPELQMMQVPEDHDIFDSFFRVVPNQVVPPYGGYPGEWYGLYEDNDRSERIMVMINANNDMAEYWEYSDRGYLPIDISNEAYKLGVNYVVYAMSH
jgi:hypothetical protein